MNHFKIIFEPEGKQIFIREDATLLEAAGQAGIILNTSCGGVGTCKKCYVYLNPDNRKVLACQYKIHSDLTVTIPAESMYFEPKILEYGISGAGTKPDIYEKYLEIAGKNAIFGVAVDIGTTTIVARLIDMVKGEILATEAVLNPQSQYGDDVISRIAFAKSKKNLKILHKTVIDCINDLISKLCQKTSINSDSIYELCAVGNTTMTHIFLGFPIAKLGFSPYKAHTLEACDVPSVKLGLKINPAGNVHTPENIAGFIGSDTVADALAAEIDSAEKITLMIDIGTNGEIVLGSKDKLYAASCAAGPAFEGARIKCGSRAAEGAIEAVVINNDDLDFDIIGNKPAHSICGSGLIDIMAVMLELGIVDHTGKFVNFAWLRNKLPDAILKRCGMYHGEISFFLKELLFINQTDIRQIQLAKAAIQAGIKLLLKQLNIRPGNIEQVLLAGAFGNYIRKESAIKIGLLPAFEPEKIHFIGNAAASGAQMILLSSENRRRSKLLAQKIRYVELADSPDFQDAFADSINF